MLKMRWLLLLCVTSGAFRLAASSDSIAPQIKSLTPEFVQRGNFAEITIHGDFLGGAKEIVISGDGGLTTEILPGTATDKKTLKIKLTATATAPVGERELRVVTPGGVSNIAHVQVGLFPETTEKEPNNSLEAAQLVVLPAVISGNVAAGDTDCFRFAAKKDERLLFDVQASRIGSKLDSTLKLYDTTGRELSRSRDVVDSDARITFAVPADGEYVLVLRDLRFQAGAYRLIVGKAPLLEAIFPLGGRRGTQIEVALSGQNLSAPTRSMKLEANAMLGRMDLRSESLLGPSNAVAFEVSDLPEFIESEPNNSAEKANLVTLPVIVNGRIDSLKDADIYKLVPKKGEKLLIEITSAKLGSVLDPLLTLRNAKGDVLSINELDGRMEYTFPDAVEYFLSVRDLHDRAGPAFGYRLSIAPPGQASPNFTVRFMPDALRVSRGSHAKIWCEVQRTGFDKDVTVSFEGLPKGITCEPVVFSMTPAPSGIFTLSASADAQMGSFPITLVAGTQSGDTKITRNAEPEYSGKVVRQAFLTIGDSAPFTITPVESVSDDEKKKIEAEIAALDTGADKARIEAAQLDWEKSFTAPAGDSPAWIGLEPTTFLAANNSKIVKADNGALLVTENYSQQDKYVITAKTDLKNIAAVRLEVLADDSLPGKGPGRAREGGNFVLTDFKVLAGDKPLTFKKATADFAQENFPIENAIDDKTETGWAIHPQTGKNHSAVFELSAPVSSETLVFHLDHQSAHGNHIIGKFRLSVTTSANAATVAKSDKTIWMPLETPEMTSTGGSRFERQKDLSIKLKHGGNNPNPEKDNFTLEGKTDVKNITGIRLETLPDPELPAQGPGRSDNGNFVLSSFKVQSNNKPVVFQKATADFEQDGWPIANTLDDSNETGWAVMPQFGKAHTAIFQPKTPIEAGALRVILEHQSPHGRHVIGRFRLSITTSANPLEGGTSGGTMLPEKFRKIVETPRETRTDAQTKELADYFRTIDPDSSKEKDYVAVLKSLLSLKYPPTLQKDKNTPVVVAIKRAGNFKGDIVLNAEGFSPGRDEKTREPNGIAKNIEVKPYTVKDDQNYAIINMKPIPKVDAATRTVVIKGQSGGAIEFSKAFPLGFAAGSAIDNSKPRKPENPKETVAGLDYKYYEGTWDVLPNFDSLQAAKTGNVPAVTLEPRGRETHFGMKFTGFIEVKKDGMYTFFVRSDDGSRFSIGDATVIDHDGLHGADEMNGKINLKTGKHALSLIFFQKEGGAGLDLDYEGPEITKQAVPAAVLFRLKKD